MVCRRPPGPALDNVGHPVSPAGEVDRQAFRDFSHVQVGILELDRAVQRHHLELIDPYQQALYFFGESVAEIFVIRGLAEVQERQYGNGWRGRFKVKTGKSIKAVSGARRDQKNEYHERHKFDVLYAAIGFGVRHQSSTG